MMLRDERTGAVYDDRTIERMRKDLEKVTGLDLSGMSERSVVANALMRDEGDPMCDCGHPLSAHDSFMTMGEAVPAIKEKRPELRAIGFDAKGEAIDPDDPGFAPFRKQRELTLTREGKPPRIR